jgi:hypothetical protein
MMVVLIKCVEKQARLQANFLPLQQQLLQLVHHQLPHLQDWRELSKVQLQSFASWYLPSPSWE